MAALDPAASSLVLTREFLLALGRPKRRIHKQTQIVNMTDADSMWGPESTPYCRTEKRISAHG